MSIIKIVAFVVVGLIGFYIYLNIYSLSELREKATKEEKKAFDRIEAFIIFAPLVVATCIYLI